MRWKACAIHNTSHPRARTRTRKCNGPKTRHTNEPNVRIYKWKCKRGCGNDRQNKKRPPLLNKHNSTNKKPHKSKIWKKSSPIRNSTLPLSVQNKFPGHHGSNQIIPWCFNSALTKPQPNPSDRTKVMNQNVSPHRMFFTSAQKLRWPPGVRTRLLGRNLTREVPSLQATYNVFVSQRLAVILSENQIQTYCRCMISRLFPNSIFSIAKIRSKGRKFIVCTSSFAWTIAPAGAISLRCKHSTRHLKPAVNRQPGYRRVDS